ncbi:MAG TPA: succinate dehydrogenase, cytochrome b556 subunit [Candidatus Azoamicus sp. OHIO2]
MVDGMKSKHIFLNIFVLNWPITAIGSIIHRLTGVFLFLSMPGFLYFFYLTIESSSSFIVVSSLSSNSYIKLVLYIFLFSFIYHAISGIKHIIMDIGYFDTKSSSKRLTIVVLVLITFLFFLSILL